jgi:hypothetical protein
LRVADSLGWGGFNGFDGAFCDAAAVTFPGCFGAFGPDFFAAEGLAEVLDCARATLLEAGFGDVLRGFPAAFFAVFLGVFLDIRLPFVAFKVSTDRALQILPPQVRIGPTRWANLMASEYGYKDSTHHPDRPLNALLKPDDG